VVLHDLAYFFPAALLDSVLQLRQVRKLRATSLNGPGFRSGSLIDLIESYVLYALRRNSRWRRAIRAGKIEVLGHRVLVIVAPGDRDVVFTRARRRRGCGERQDS